MQKLARYILFAFCCFIFITKINAAMPPHWFWEDNETSPNIVEGVILEKSVLEEKQPDQYNPEVLVEKNVLKIQITDIKTSEDNLATGNVIEVTCLIYTIPESIEGGTDTWMYEAYVEKKIQNQTELLFHLETEDENGRYELRNNFMGIVAPSFYMNDNSFKNNEGSQATSRIIKNTNSTSFTDVSEGNSSYEAIQYMKEKGIIEGYSDGTFRPNNTINRAEFLKILIEAKFEENEIENCIAQNSQPNWTYLFFYDVKPNDWFAKYVCVAKVKNIVGGYPDGTFKANNKVTFAEVAKIIVETFELNYQETNTQWYAPYVQALSDRNAIPKSIRSVEAELTRGDMAEILWRVMENVTNLWYAVFENGMNRCVPYGEHLTLSNEECCQGSILRKDVMSNENECTPFSQGVICLPCGNGICESEYGENFCNCSEDCEKE